MDWENNYGFGPEWKVSEEDPGYMTRTYVIGNATCEVLRPILAPEERAKREKQVMRTVASVVGPHIINGRMRDDENERTA